MKKSRAKIDRAAPDKQFDKDFRLASASFSAKGQGILMDRVGDHVGQDAQFGPSSDDVEQTRHQARDSMFLAAQFRESAKRRQVSQVRVRNLSAGGLMADYTAPIAPGTAVEVEVRGIGWIAGRVAWCEAGRIGVAFDFPVEPNLARKPVKAGVKAPVVVKPILPLT